MEVLSRRETPSKKDTQLGGEKDHAETGAGFLRGQISYSWPFDGEIRD